MHVVFCKVLMATWHRSLVAASCGYLNCEWLLCCCRWRHRQVLGAVLMSSIGSTSRCCQLSPSRSCPSCRHCLTASSDSSSRVETSSWNGPAASSSPWIPGMPEERNCPITSSRCFGRSLWWFQTPIWSPRSSCSAKVSTTRRFLVVIVSVNLLWNEIQCFRV